MTNPLLYLIAVYGISCSLVTAQEVEEGIEHVRELPGWGTWIDPDGDCEFFVMNDKLAITVPGSDDGHDLAPEIDRTNAPRVVRKVNGDFSVQVRIEGRFTPGDESTIEGRTGYNGAGIIAMPDDQNVVTLARAVLQRKGGEPAPYINFEIRVDGKLERMGVIGDHPITVDDPVFLLLERKGGEFLGSVSEDGIKWDALTSKTVPKDWPEKLSTGLVAISTSKAKFNPKFSELKILNPKP